MALFLHRGAGTEVSRFQLANIAQEKALAFVLCQEERLSASSAAAAADAETNNMILFFLRGYGAALTVIRSSFVASPTSEESKPFAAVGGSLHQRMQQMGSRFNGEMWATAEATPDMVRYWEHCVSHVSDFAGSASTRDETWKLRRDFMKDSAAITGDTSHANQETWTDVPTHALSGGRLMEERVSALERACDAMEGGQLDQARQIVDGAWEREVFYQNGDGRHKAQLLELRAAICERDGDWESGAHLRSEAAEARRVVPSDGLGGLGVPVRESSMGDFLDQAFCIAAFCCLVLLAVA
jgi:hypothetical protein